MFSFFPNIFLILFLIVLYNLKKYFKQNNYKLLAKLTWVYIVSIIIHSLFFLLHSSSFISFDTYAFALVFSFLNIIFFIPLILTIFLFQENKRKKIPSNNIKK